MSKVRICDACGKVIKEDDPWYSVGMYFHGCVLYVNNEPLDPDFEGDYHKDCFKEYILDYVPNLKICE